VERITGVSPDALRSAAEALVGGERPFLLYGPQVARGERGKAVLAALGNIATLLGGPERLGYFALDANAQGARDVGLHPELLPGQRSLDDEGARRRLKQIWGEDVPTRPGMTYSQMLRAAAEGRISAMYVMGADPASEGPAYKAALEKLDFLVVQDIFLTETAKLADVVLPASSYMESSGTFTNVERRVQMAPEAMKPMGRSMPDWVILLNLANRWPQPEEEENKRGKKRRKSRRKEWRYHHTNDISCLLGQFHADDPFTCTTLFSIL
jgi:predicted molibdopterin-dependent oxidoreductase YjgC